MRRAPSSTSPSAGSAAKLQADLIDSKLFDAASARVIEHAEAVSTALRRLLDEGSPKLYFLSGYSRMALTGIGASYSSMLTALEEEGFEIGFLDDIKRILDRTFATSKGSSRPLWLTP